MKTNYPFMNFWQRLLKWTGKSCTYHIQLNPINTKCRFIQKYLIIFFLNSLCWQKLLIKNKNWQKVWSLWMRFYFILKKKNISKYALNNHSAPRFSIHCCSRVYQCLEWKIKGLCVCVCECESVCVCVRQTEREREKALCTCSCAHMCPCSGTYEQETQWKCPPLSWNTATWSLDWTWDCLQALRSMRKQEKLSVFGLF